MKFTSLKTTIAFLTIVLCTSCEEVIDIDLNSANPVLVAEGVVDNELPAWVRLTYTSDYFDAEQAKVEPGATVIISDKQGNTETMEYIADGLYQARNFIGNPNNQYTLSIIKDGVEYQASTMLLPPSEILSVSFEENENLRPGQTETTYAITINFKDDTLSRNYYLIKFQTSGELDEDAGSYYLIDDYSYKNTGEIEYSPLRLNFNLGEEVKIELYSIDKNTYNYYSEMNNASGGMMGGSSTPYTPTSNFGSNVLGYFAAWSKVEYNGIVQ